MIKIAKYNESGRCPICGSRDIEYEHSEQQDNFMVYPQTCMSCRTTWNEWCKIEFSGNYQITDTNGVIHKTMKELEENAINELHRKINGRTKNENRKDNAK